MNQNWDVIKKRDEYIWVKIIAHIKDNDTGEIRKYETDAIYDEESEMPSIFIWEEGNFSCDCNRHLFFRRAKNEQDDFGFECGHSRYSVNLQNPKTGEYFYREF